MAAYRQFYTSKSFQTDVSDSLEETLASLSLNPKQDSPVSDTEYILNNLESCPLCDCVYKRKGDLKNHLVTNHQVNKESIYFKCSCGVTCDDQKKYSRHVKHNGH